MVFLGMIHITIGPNNAFQALAWSKMLFDYSDGRTLTEAAEMTFDGEHPCPLCLAIAQTRDDEKKDPAIPPERLADRNELFPQENLAAKTRRLQAKADGPPSPTPLLAHCRFVPKRPTPPPQFS